MLRYGALLSLMFAVFMMAEPAPAYAAFLQPGEETAGDEVEDAGEELEDAADELGDAAEKATDDVDADVDAAVEDVEEDLTGESEGLTEKAVPGSADDKDDDADDPLASVAPSELDIELRLEWMFNALIMFICGVLVIFMQAGFAMVESGFNAAKNTVNILSKNVMDLCVGVLLYWLVGWGIMYPGDWIADGWFGYAGPGVAYSEPYNPPSVDDLPEDATPEQKAQHEKDLAELPEKLAAYHAQDDVLSAADIKGASEDDGYAVHPQVDFFFQVAFAATAATIVSGAVAGRMKFTAYLAYSAVLTALVYPISGSWKWGAGWLDAMGFHDFAGSLIVHALGGFAGLAGAMVLGPRIGRYSEDGRSQPLPGHNLSIATLGVFILFVGWFGFNPGSVLTYWGAEGLSLTVLVANNTLIAGAAGGVAAIFFAWGMFKKPDLSMALNGVLGGLVGITANADLVSNLDSIFIGLVAGVLVVLGVILLDKLKIDDPVGAWPVHGLCGIWGGLACAFFGGKEFFPQLVGSIVIPVWAFVTMFALFYSLKVCGMLRVSAEEETAGLDISEHGMHAYLNS